MSCNLDSPICVQKKANASHFRGVILMWFPNNTKVECFMIPKFFRLYNSFNPVGSAV